MIVGLHGAARSGKSTVAGHLVRHHGFDEVMFAAKLKEICADVFGLTHDQVNGDKKEVVDPRYGVTPRLIMQHIGTEGFRAVHRNVWVNYAIRSIPKGVNVVISDMRFENELSAVRRSGGIAVKLVRRGHDGAFGGIPEHASEQPLPDDMFDFVVEADDGDIDELFRQADMIANAVGLLPWERGA